MKQFKAHSVWSPCYTGISYSDERAPGMVNSTQSINHCMNLISTSCITAHILVLVQPGEVRHNGLYLGPTYSARQNKNLAPTTWDHTAFRKLWFFSTTLLYISRTRQRKQLEFVEAQWYRLLVVFGGYVTWKLLAEFRKVWLFVMLQEYT